MYLLIYHLVALGFLYDDGDGASKGWKVPCCLMSNLAAQVGIGALKFILTHLDRITVSYLDFGHRRKSLKFGRDFNTTRLPTH